MVARDRDGLDAITIFITKNISELDFILPVVRHVKLLWPKVNINVMYCVHDKRQILRKCALYSELFNELGVKEYDLLDFFNGSGLKKLRECFEESRWDSGKESALLPAVFSRRIKMWRQLRAERRVEEGLDYRGLKGSLSSDIYFWPHRSIYPGIAEMLWEKLACAEAENVLYPHGPYYSAGSFEVPLPPDCRVARDGEIPDNFDFWYPHKADDIPERYSSSKDNIFFSGYPGLDTGWLDFIRKRYGKERTPEAPVRFLFLIRKFMDNSTDAWAYETSEFAAICKSISRGIEDSGVEVEFTVKPHPSNDYTAVRRFLDDMGLSKWKITYDPVYLATVKSDVVVSVPSTSNLIPVLSGLPVVFLATSVRKAFNRWNGMEDLYPDTLRFFAATNGEIPIRIKEAVNLVLSKDSDMDALNKDIEHFRLEFPDNMLALIEDRVKLLSTRATQRQRV
jgi:hypothetical protein